MVLLGRQRRRQWLSPPSSEPSEVQKHLGAYAPATEAMQSADTLVEDNEAEAKVKLYDTIDHTWTQPVSQMWANRFYLNKVVYVCSACGWNDIWKNNFQEHLKSVSAGAKRHLKAEVISAVTSFGGGFRCTGCNSTYAHPSRAERHIEMARGVPDHRNAELRVARRFALGPLAATQVVAKASQPERTVEPRLRRRRHHRRRSAHGSEG